MAVSTDHRLMIEMQVSSRRKSMGVAYALWFFLGLLSIHRFYLERPGSAILQIILNCFVIGLFWTLFDVFLIPGMVRAYDDKVRADLYARTGAYADDYGRSVAPEPEVDTSRWSRRERAAYAAGRRSRR